MRQSRVNLAPVIAVVPRTEHLIAVAAGKKVAVRSSYQRIDAIPCNLPIVNRLPAVAVVS